MPSFWANMPEERKESPPACVTASMASDATVVSQRRRCGPGSGSVHVQCSDWYTHTLGRHNHHKVHPNGLPMPHATIVQARRCLTCPSYPFLIPLPPSLLVRLETL
jgi:hypothetical protein